MPRLLERQAPLAHAGVDLEALDLIPTPMEALLVDGVDAGAIRRAHVRALNAQRQTAEADREAAKVHRQEARARSHGQRTLAQQVQTARMSRRPAVPHQSACPLPPAPEPAE